ncbi:Tryptophan--tRNA ligase, mitochondrial [Leucoagaricus sp. SymC.cos]|nr:Tryptophan--tRNA ligase, mitochondrial [Leucoagaricus sp. SymC.cos]
MLSRLVLHSARALGRRSIHSKHVVLSGIQPTCVPHLGNYLGAVSNWVKLQETADPQDGLLFMIVGWHALTLPQDPKRLAAERWDMLATLLAIGLDPKRSIIFHQDHVHHVELAWLMNCISPVGRLFRMTTWKSRIATSRNGLLTYSSLQAADILVYRATHVPVGEDQTQHLELTRDLADSFNKTFKSKGPLFPLPVLVGTQSRRVLSLKDSSKMSKSAPDVSSRILLTDSPSQVKVKIRGAVTDTIQGITYDPINRPGTANLLTILAACTNEDAAKVATRCEGQGHGVLKADVAEAVTELLRKPQGEFARIREERVYLVQVADEGARKAKELSNETMRHVRECVGLC